MNHQPKVSSDLNTLKKKMFDIEEDIEKFKNSDMCSGYTSCLLKEKLNEPFTDYEKICYDILEELFDKFDKCYDEIMNEKRRINQS